MRLGAVLGGAHRAGRSQPGRYGRAVGLAFQIVDDVLDLTATEEVLGKPVASDLREGKATLPVIHSFDHGTAADRQIILAFSKMAHFENVHPRADPGDPAPQRLGRIRHARGRPLRRAGSRGAQPSYAEDSEFKRALLWVPDFVRSSCSTKLF
jgi:octaprenyl-diphosphate synthase